MSADALPFRTVVAALGWYVRLFSFRKSQQRAKSFEQMERLIAEACKRPIRDIQRGRFDLSDPGGEIILPRVWEAVIEANLEVTTHFWPVENEALQPSNDQVVGHCQQNLEQWQRDREQERERWGNERLVERERWERERLLERQRWEGERDRERELQQRQQRDIMDLWDRQQREARTQWERAQERERRDWEREMGARIVIGNENPTSASMRKNKSDMSTRISPCLLWLSGRFDQRR